MARKNKENKNMALSTVLRDEADSSEDDYRRKRDKNNQVFICVSLIWLLLYAYDSFFIFFNVLGCQEKSSKEQNAYTTNIATCEPIKNWKRYAWGKD